ncbi:AAA family ATPase [Actinoplanes sp. TBRC 11911]|uniref:AAA family ATPase n=1 Tax=Actinoplanes sp. TBRC 11911 TaxID=2729386 RepID=UPI00145E5635|nr:AAA family ATPase [Actinoplanes sp. TBRC 11911]NMO54000.1 AAA family ATPase [Actinoplanes sp. TBRC 11911]
MADLYLQILGPLRVWRDGVELDTGPRQQCCLLAVLLARAGKPVSTHELIDLIWGDDVPASALNILQKYVGTLRRLLEPARPARGPGSYLRRRGNGYLFEPGPGMLDVVSFRELVEAAKAGATPEVALGHYARALPLWHGAAGDGLTTAAASSIFTALDGEFFDACVAAAGLAVSRGEPERVLPSVRLAARMAPLHETVQAALVVTLAATGRTAEALSVFQAVRARLAEELGIDPGPALLAAHQRALRQPAPAEAMPAPATGLVDRAEELAVLRHTLAAAFGGGSALAVVEGEPGVGKTRLLAEIAAEASRRGAFVVWGRCLDGDGTPSMWPWVQAVGTLLGELSVAAREQWQGGDLGRLLEPGDGAPAAPVLPDTGARFRLFERTVELTGQIAARRPLLLVIDDLQWADVASLQLFGHLAARLPDGVVIVGALRDRAPVPGSELARMLAAASRLPQHRRIRLGPLGEAEVSELVRRETGREPGPGAAHSIHARTGGNPFFVRELSRFLAGGGPLTGDAAARAGVPSTVRDIVRDRMAGLDDDARDLVRIAALAGRDVELGLLARAAGVDSLSCLDRLEPPVELGMLEPAPGDPFAFRFTHDLVRESVVRATPAPLATRLHLRIADALEQTGDEPVAERLAHHLWAAGPLADPARTAAALVDAGRRAAAKSAFEAAEQQLRAAAQIARTAGLAELELSALSRFAAVSGMRSGYVGSALDQLERAELLARKLGREREAADFLFSRWAAYSQGIRLDRAGRLARQLLDEGEASTDSLVRAYGRHAWGIHRWDVGDIGTAFRYLDRTATMLDDPADGGAYSLRRDLRLLWPVMRALMTALHGDVGGARAQLDTMEAGADGDPYVITVWAAFSVTIAALAGHPDWARRAADRGIAVDPEATFVFLGAYQRLGRCWARAVSGEDPAAAATEAAEIIAGTLLDPPRSGVATWYGLLAEMWLAAGRPAAAAAALDRAGALLDTHGQRYPEGFLLLMRARLARARGEPESAVRAVAESARALSVARGAHLFARRAEKLAGGLHASRGADFDGA